MEGTEFNPNRIRTFAHGNVDDFFGIRINAVLGNNRSYSCEIDQETGRIKLPKGTSWEKVGSRADLRALKSQIVDHFVPVVLTRPGERIVVAQRVGHTLNYRNASTQMGGMDLLEHRLAPVMSSHFEGGTEGWAAWLQPMNRGNSNRIDVWVVDPDGAITLYVIYILSLDNMVTCGALMQQRWVGNVHRRLPGSTYQLPPNVDERAVEWYKDANVQDLLNKFVFVPGEHSEDFFSSRGSILLNSQFREMILSLENLPVWGELEDFWVKRPPSRELKPNEAVVDFWTYGHGRKGHGILCPSSPVMIQGVEYVSLQFDHDSVDIPPEFYDDQGLLDLPSGTIVEWKDAKYMGLDKQTGKPYPAKVGVVVHKFTPPEFEEGDRRAA